jgi:hypothetical protein
MFIFDIYREADDTNGDDQRSWMTAERMTQQGCDD